MRKFATLTVCLILAAFSAACSGADANPAAPGATALSAGDNTSPTSNPNPSGPTPAIGSGPTKWTAVLDGGPAGINVCEGNYHVPQINAVPGSKSGTYKIDITSPSTRDFELVAILHRTDDPGCAATTEHGIAMPLSGKTSFKIGDVGSFVATLDLRRLFCHGHGQPDIQAIDRNTREPIADMFFVGEIVNSLGEGDCESLPPPPTTEKPKVNWLIEAACVLDNGVLRKAFILKEAYNLLEARIKSEGHPDVVFTKPATIFVDDWPNDTYYATAKPIEGAEFPDHSQTGKSGPLVLKNCTTPPPEVTCTTIGLSLTNTTATVNPTNVTVNPTATFTGPGPTTVNWGDGSPAQTVTSGTPISHTFTRSATEEFTRTVTFSDSQLTPACAQSFTVTVPKLPPPPPPTCAEAHLDWDIFQVVPAPGDSLRARLNVSVKWDINPPSEAIIYFDSPSNNRNYGKGNSPISWDFDRHDSEYDVHIRATIALGNQVCTINHTARIPPKPPTSNVCSRDSFSSIGQFIVSGSTASLTVVLKPGYHDIQFYAASYGIGSGATKTGNVYYPQTRVDYKTPILQPGSTTITLQLASPYHYIGGQLDASCVPYPNPLTAGNDPNQDLVSKVVIFSNNSN